jgi:hypothetical protein
MKRFLVIAGSLLLVVHAFVAWIQISYPQPDSTQTVHLWQQGYVEAGLPDWHLPPIAERTFFLWIPFDTSTDLIASHSPLALRLFISITVWLGIALFFRFLVRYIWSRKHDHVA